MRTFCVSLVVAVAVSGCSEGWAELDAAPGTGKVAGSDAPAGVVASTGAVLQLSRYDQKLHRGGRWFVGVDAGAGGGSGGGTISGAGGGTGGGTVSGSGGTGGGTVSGSGGGTVSGTGGGTGGGSGGGTVSGSGGGTSGTVITPGDPGSADLRFDVRSDRGTHPISPLIYGTNSAPSLSQNRFGVLRLGGNRLTAYNWENNASNAGSDYLYQNDNYLSSSTTAGAPVTTLVNNAKSINAAALVTIPIVDYVAADTNGGGDVRNTVNYLTTRFKQNRAVKGAALSSSPDVTDAYVNQDEFVSWLKSSQSTKKILFSLDNEPDLWSSTHAEIHPLAVTYAELVSRNITYATMVKNVWPTAEVTGFVSYGWNGFTTLQGAPDKGTNGDFTDYYLDKMKAAHATAGKRLIDYLDLHWYPEATGGGVRITDSGTGSSEVAARVQASRSLWDPTYTETSWVAQSLGQPIRLVRRMQEKIAAHYPGTKLAFTEWNYGGGGHISGSVAVADVLGIFGREGVGLATYWELNSDETFAYAAFRAFRNYDGSGGQFGDTAISSVSSDEANGSIYASVDSTNPSRVVLIAINKSTVARTAGVTVAHSSAFTKLKVFTLSGTNAQLVASPDASAVATNAFHLTLPPLSVQVLVPVP